MAGSVDLSISVDGAAIAKLAALAGGVEAALGMGIHHAAEQIAPAIQGNMHFDRGYSTGATEASVSVRDEGPLAVSIGPEMPYDAYVEWGTYKMAPEPFDQPTMPQARTIAEQAVRDAILALLGGP